GGEGGARLDPWAPRGAPRREVGAPVAELEGRVLGLDLGDVRIGVAISDPERRLAVPLGTVHTGAPADLKAVAALVREHDVTAVVVGLPLRMSGETGTRAVHAKGFADALGSVLDVPVV